MSNNILHIDSSPRGGESVSKKLTAQVVENLKSKQPNSTVTYKDLSTGVPFVDSQVLAGYWSPAEDHSEEVKKAVLPSNQAIQEIMDADTIVIGVPMWNFHIPATVKAWVDLIVRTGLTFTQDENGYKGLLPPGKKAYVVVTTGGVAIGTDYDMASKYMQAILSFIGISDIEIIGAGGLMLPDGEATLKAAQDQIAAI